MIHWIPRRLGLHPVASLQTLISFGTIRTCVLELKQKRSTKLLAEVMTWSLGRRPLPRPTPLHADAPRRTLANSLAVVLSTTSLTSPPNTASEPNMDQYMLEYELDADGERIPEATFFGWKLTQRAKDAQRAKWQRLMDNRLPMSILPAAAIARNGSKPPLLFYGFPFKNQFMVNYARRHKLEMKLAEVDRIRSGTDALRFAELKDEDITGMERVIARSLVARHLGRACGGIRLDIGSPLTFEWDGILALWSNYNMHERHRWIQLAGRTLEDVIAIMNEAMNEDGQTTEIRWWWDFDNNVNLFHTPD